MIIKPTPCETLQQQTIRYNTQQIKTEVLMLEPESIRNLNGSRLIEQHMTNAKCLAEITLFNNTSSKIRLGI